MRTVRVQSPSFPEVEPEQALNLKERQVWQVLCGDREHWRVGIYSPQMTGPDQIEELEQHDCPEFFWLLDGRLTLVLAREGALEQLDLEPGRPVLVQSPHSGFCPDGPHTGRALVVERDVFETRYASAAVFGGDQT
jgi:hypothetical protein